MLIRNLEQTNKLLANDLKTSKGLPNDKKENIKKSIVVNQGLINYYKENYKNLKNNESIVKENKSDCGCNKVHDCGCGGNHKH
jgi:transcription initiation factor IIF auxiliary subunit